MTTTARATEKIELSIGKTIQRQLQVGILMSCGARNLRLISRDGLHGLVFNVGPGKINNVQILLNAGDTYDISYWRGLEKKEEVTDVYIDSLNSTVRRLGDRKSYR